MKFERERSQRIKGKGKSGQTSSQILSLQVIITLYSTPTQAAEALSAINTELHGSNYNLSGKGVAALESMSWEYQHQMSAV